MCRTFDHMHRTTTTMPLAAWLTPQPRQDMGRPFSSCLAIQHSPLHLTFCRSARILLGHPLWLLFAWPTLEPRHGMGRSLLSALKHSILLHIFFLFANQLVSFRHNPGSPTRVPQSERRGQDADRPCTEDDTDEGENLLGGGRVIIDAEHFWRYWDFDMCVFCCVLCFFWTDGSKTLGCGIRCRGLGRWFTADLAGRRVEVGGNIKGEMFCRYGTMSLCCQTLDEE